MVLAVSFWYCIQACACGYLRCTRIHSSAVPSPTSLVPTQRTQTSPVKLSIVRKMEVPSVRTTLPAGWLSQVSAGVGMPAVAVHSRVTEEPYITGLWLLLPLIDTFGCSSADKAENRIVLNHGHENTSWVLTTCTHNTLVIKYEAKHPLQGNPLPFHVQTLVNAYFSPG